MATLARHLEASGWACLYVPDHFIPADERGRPKAGGMLEAWTTLTGLAASTSTVGVGTLVLGNTYRHPTVVANMAAALDQVSGGRLVLGLGAGGQVNEHAAYGIELPLTAERLDRFEEAVSVVVALLTRDRVDFDGRWYRLIDAVCEPKPLQSPLPVLVGGRSRRTMRVAARFATLWHAWGSPAELRDMNAVVDDICRDLGRDPTTLRRASGGSDPNDVPGLVAAGVDEIIWRDDAAIDVATSVDRARAFAEAIDRSGGHE